MGSDQVQAERPVLWREALLGLAVFGVYTAVAGLDWPGRDAAADRHGRQIFAFERAVHLDLEPALNAWLAGRPALRIAANYEYAYLYLLSTIAMLCWLYLRRPELYRWARRWFVLLNLIGLACFALYPVTPPRLLPALGFVDTVREGQTWGSWGGPLVGHANQLAAMPSLHVAWVLWVCALLLYAGAPRWVQLASGCQVLLTGYVIMATANHYLLDALAGAALVAVLLGLAISIRHRTPRSLWRARERRVQPA